MMLIEKPNSGKKMNVPMSETGITMHGMSVTRQLRRKRKMMMMTRMKAS